jgi:AraC family transcriptional regulator, transcriptional activator of pobA
LHKLRGIQKQKHPLVSLINYSDVHLSAIENSVKVILNSYNVSIKHNSDCRFSYGQNYYDFDEGVLAFMESGQIASSAQNGNTQMVGYWFFTPTLLETTQLAKT